MKLVLHDGASSVLFTLFWYYCEIKLCGSSSFFSWLEEMACFFKTSLALTENRLLLSSLNKGWWDFYYPWQILWKFHIWKHLMWFHVFCISVLSEETILRGSESTPNTGNVLTLLITTWTVSRIPENLESSWNAVQRGYAVLWAWALTVLCKFMEGANRQIFWRLTVWQ